MSHSPSIPFLRGSMSVVIAASVLHVGCTSSTRDAPREVPVQATPGPPEAAAEAPIEQRMQGTWKVRSSSGKGSGYAFAALVGETIVIDGDRLSYQEHASDARGAPTTYTTTKIVTLLPGSSPQAIDLEQTSDAKGWSRAGIIVVKDDMLFLSMNYSSNPRPTNLEPADDGREVVILERLPTQ